MKENSRHTISTSLERGKINNQKDIAITQQQEKLQNQADSQGVSNVMYNDE